MSSPQITVQSGSQLITLSPPDISDIINNISNTLSSIQSAFSSFFTDFLFKPFMILASTIGNFFWGIGQSIGYYLSIAFGVIRDGIVAFGQSIASGISSIFSGFVNELQYAFTSIGDFFSTGFSGFVDGIKYIGSAIWNFLTTAGNLIWNGLQFLANGIIGVGTWFYNGLLIVAHNIVNIMETIANAIYNAFNTVYNVIVGAFTGQLANINTWFTDFIVGLRNKLILKIQADLTIFGMWKVMNNFWKEPTIKGLFRAIIGTFGSYALATIFSSFLDNVIPKPQTNPINLLPNINIPQINFESVQIQKSGQFASSPSAISTSLSVPLSDAILSPSLNIQKSLSTGLIDVLLNPAMTLGMKSPTILNLSDILGLASLNANVIPTSFTLIDKIQLSYNIQAQITTITVNLTDSIGISHNP